MRQKIISLTLCSLPYLFSSQVFAWGELPFGSTGQEGARGQSGRSGRSGPNRVVNVNDQGEFIDLSGEDGEDGQFGYPGSPATGCFPMQNNPPYNLIGAAGGEGGAGGSGGSGGDGGSVTFYFENIADLKNIHVRSIPGRGGMGGEGSRGGDGCRCFIPVWRGPNGQLFNCIDGPYGADGIYGSRGRDGSSGTATLVQHIASLPAVKSNMQTSLDQWGHDPIEVSAIRWSLRSGIRQVLAPDSIMNDQYYFYEGVFKKSMSLVWGASRSMDEFSDIQVAGSVAGQFPNEQLSLKFSQGFWYRGRDMGQNQFKITEAYRESEALQVVFDHLRGNGSNTTVTLSDVGEFGPKFSTAFFLKFERKFVGYSTRFEGLISPSAVSRQGQNIVINIGQLPIDPKYLSRKDKIRLTLRMDRKFDGFATSKVLLNEQEFKLE